MIISKLDADKIAGEIADELYAHWETRNKPCSRIQFKSGLWPNETDEGGMCKAAFKVWLSEQLMKRRKLAEW